METSRVGYSNDLETDIRVFRGLRVFAAGYRSFVNDRMRAVYGARWIDRASLSEGSDPGKPLDSYALLKTTIDRWNEAFRQVLGPEVRNRIGLLLEARNRLAHEDPSEEAISFLSAMSFVAEAVGAQGSLPALRALLAEQMNSTGRRRERSTEPKVSLVQPEGSDNEYWVYENWIQNRARVHRGTCGFCNHGRGIQESTSEERGRWHGPFADRAAAVAHMNQLGRADSRPCSVCGA
jgi:hypothetical protein